VQVQVSRPIVAKAFGVPRIRASYSSAIGSRANDAGSVRELITYKNLYLDANPSPARDL